MSNAGQAILTIGGAIVGSFFGMPQLGYLLGSYAGQALFPTDLGTINGPRLNDLTVQSSAIGVPIPIVYGTYAVSGNLIWSSGIIEAVTRKKQGGKGGPTQTVRTYSYSVNCAIGICEGEIAGISRIWADSKLIYDSRPQFAEETNDDYAGRIQANASNVIEFYLGSATQLPDPTIESFEGAGNVSGFRDLAYVVFSEFQLADYGNRIPNFRFEIAGQASPVLVGAYTPGFLPYWNLEATVRDPRSQGAEYEYNTTARANAIQPWFSNLQYVLDTYGGEGVGYWSDSPWGYTNADTSLSPAAYRLGYYPCSVGTYPGPALVAAEQGGGDFGGKMAITMYFNAVPSATAVCLTYGESYGTFFDGSNDNDPYHLVNYLDQNSTDNPAVYMAVGDLAPNTISGKAADIVGNMPEDRKLIGINDTVVVVRRSLQAPPPPCFYATDTYTDTLNAITWCYLEGLWIQSTVDWEPIPGNILGLGRYTFTGSSYLTHTCTGRPITDPLSGLTIGRYRPEGHPDDNQAFWEAEYAWAVANGHMEPGLVYGVDYPVGSSGGWGIEYSGYSTLPGRTSLAAIVADVCRRCGLTEEQVDVSDLTEPVDGYVISRVMNGRSAIEPLRSFGFFDCVESEGQLRWPTRGKAAVAALTADDLCAHTTGGERPPAVLTARAQEVDLPRRLRVHYAQKDFNYEQGEQSASRLSGGTVDVRDVELAIAMSDSKAAQIAEVLLYDAWVARNSHQIALGIEHVALEPADAVLCPVDGRQQRLRMTAIDYSNPGIMRCEAVRDDDGSYVSYALGSPSAPATVGAGSSSISIIGTADLVLMDLPLLRDADDDAGYYAAVQAIGGTAFGGAELYRSPDGGTTYESVASMPIAATIGTVDEALPPGLTTVIDEGNALLVTLDSGELESVSEASLLAGLNAAAIGADNRWEIIQFRDAELLGSPPQYVLTGLLRGRRGTEWAMGLSEAGDRFVLLDSSVVRVPLNIAGIGAAKFHKPVLIGRSLETTTAVSFTPEGVALEPFSVVSIAATRDGGDDIELTWVRRGRIGEELPSGADVPLSEEFEAYEVDVMDGPDVVRTISSIIQSATYSSADQIADFGSNQAAVTVRIYQLSAVVGRGYVSEATV